MGDTCQMRRCFEPATHSVHLRFWAKGYPRDTHPPVVSETVVVCCDLHKADVLAQDWYGPEARRQLREAMQSIGRAEPDFDTAEVFLRPLEPTAENKPGSLNE